MFLSLLFVFVVAAVATVFCLRFTVHQLWFAVVCTYISVLYILLLMLMLMLMLLMMLLLLFVVLFLLFVGCSLIIIYMYLCTYTHIYIHNPYTSTYTYSPSPPTYILYSFFFFFFFYKKILVNMYLLLIRMGVFNHGLEHMIKIVKPSPPPSHRYSIYTVWYL